MNKRILIDVIIILIIGLLPILWLPNNSLILGHDAGLALDPIMHFLDRIHVWSQRFSLGTDQNGALLGAFFIHGFEALLPYLGLNLHWSQLVQFIFWFTLPGLAMYYFAYKTFPDKKYLPLIASVIYMLNFYLLQAWFVAERTKFSMYIAFPLVLYFLINYLTGKSGFFKTIVLTGVVLGIFNGGGSFPLYGGLAFSVVCVFAYVNFINFNLETVKRTVFYTVGVGLVYTLLNAYWLIPYFFYITGFFSRDLAQAGGVEGAITWAKYLSAQSTFINIFRGQGIPDWYLNPFHAYAQSFFTNPLLILVSFLFPILAFASVLVKKTPKDAFYIYLLILICLVGILFSSGPQSQLGFIYEFMVKYIPGFAMFRSAFFKFNYMLWFSYALLIGFTLNYFLSKLELRYFKARSFLFSTVALMVFVTGYIFYHYPVLNGSFLDYSSEPGKELTTRVTIPEYILDFGKWVNNQHPDVRFLVMPQLGESSYISYDWRYWSLAPVSSLLSRNSFVHNNALAPGSEKILMGEMYAAFLRGDMQSFNDFSEVFAIDKIVVQKDYDWKNATWGTINPERYEEVLRAHPELFTHEKTFGKWVVYKINERNQSLRINSSTKLTYLEGKLGKVVSFPYFEPKSPLFMSDVEGENSYYAQNATDLYLAPECIQCDLVYKDQTFQYYNPKFLPGSTFYPIVTYREKKLKESSGTFMSQLSYFLATADRRIIETKWMVDSRRNIEEILPNIERYKQTLRELANHLRQDEWDPSAFEENKAAQMVLNNIREEVNLIDSIYQNNLLSIDHKQALAEAYNEILEVEKYAGEKLWITDDMTNKRYIFDLPLTGNYDVYVKKGSLTYPEYDPKDTTISFKEQPDVLKPLQTIDDWLYFGAVDLNNKKAFISIKDGTMVNMIDSLAPEYPDGKQGITQDKNNFTFTTDSLNKCIYYQFHDLEFLNTQYVVSFNYRNFSDKNTLSFFNQSEGDPFLKYGIKDASLKSSRYFTHFTKLISPKDGNIRLNFCNGFLSLYEMSNFAKDTDAELLPEGNTLIQIKDLTFSKVAYPNIVLYRKQKDVTDKNTVKSFTKKDPVTYTVEMEKSDQPVSLMMRESYGIFWKVCDENNKCLPFDDNSHFANAGFANAWYLKDKGLGNNLTLYYYPQRWYVLGTIITLISIVLILIALLCIKILKIK